MANTVKLLNKTSLLISGLKTSLTSISKKSSRFIELGRDLQSVYSDAEALTQSVLDAAGMIKGEYDDNLLSDIGSFAKDPLNKLESFKSGLSDIFPRFESCLNHIKKLNEICPGIIKIAKTLNTIAFNISKETSRTKTAEDMFCIFVKEIKELAKNANEISRRIKDDTENSKLTQENEFEKILDGIDQLDTTSCTAKEMVSENISRIDDVMNLSLNALNEAEVNSQKISKLIGDVVVAIQFHDITGQQIEHVIEGLPDLETTISGKDELSDRDEDNSNQLGNAYYILRLQIMQTKQIIIEVKDAHEKIAAAFKDIVNVIETLANGVNRIGGGKQDGAFNLLLSGLENLERTISNGEGLAVHINNTMKKTSISASNISNYISSMQDISIDLHIKALNALIMSKKLGASGITLSVLAQHVTEVSKNSDDFVVEVIDILKSIQASAKDLNGISLKLNDGSYYGCKNDSTLGDGINAISHIYDSFINKTELSRQGAALLKSRIFEIESGLTFLTEMNTNLEKCLKQMEEMVNELSPFLSYGQKKSKDLSMLQSRYTMEIERGIHNISIGDNGEMVEETRPLESELGENVELF